MPIPYELLSELGTPAAVIISFVSIYLLEINRRKTGIKAEPPKQEDHSDSLKLWMIENIKDPILKAIRNE